MEKKVQSPMRVYTSQLLLLMEKNGLTSEIRSIKSKMLNKLSNKTIKQRKRIKGVR